MGSLLSQSLHLVHQSTKFKKEKCREIIGAQGFIEIKAWRSNFGWRFLGHLLGLPSPLQIYKVGTLSLFSLKFYAPFHAFKFLVDLFGKIIGSMLVDHERLMLVFVNSI